MNDSADLFSNEIAIPALKSRYNDAYFIARAVVALGKTIKTIGIILCKNKKESTIKYTLGKDNKQIFASKYKMYFPEKQILKLISEQ